MDEQLRWQVVAREPLAATDAVHAAVVRAGAWIERSEAYSNVSLCLVLGMAAADVPAVARALAAVPGITPSDKTRVALAALGGLDGRGLQPDAPPTADPSCAARTCEVVVGRPWTPTLDDGDVYATLALTFPKGDGSVARTRPPG